MENGWVERVLELIGELIEELSHVLPDGCQVAVGWASDVRWVSDGHRMDVQ